MAELYAGGCFIDFLSAGAGAADKTFRQVFLTDLQGGHPRVELFPFFLRNHGGM